jgi:hypothetical protein
MWVSSDIVFKDITEESVFVAAKKSLPQKCVLVVAIARPSERPSQYIYLRDHVRINVY